MLPRRAENSGWAEGEPFGRPIALRRGAITI